MSEHHRLADVERILSDSNISDALLWGEHAMRLHGIPAVALRDDLVINDNDLDLATAALVSKGWREQSSTQPPSRAGFWLEGWQDFMGSGRRLLYPDSYQDLQDQELLLLPRSYLGLDPLSPALHDTSSGLSYPSATALAGSIANVFSKASGHCALLMQAWAAYFLQYGVLEKDAVDELVARNPECWQELLHLT
ncbi:hypothetical protein DXG01_007802 [Tephrocybe rancida]|nr:hypothetical protein DXG01_007802 [Tephrocybe rancida]